MFKVRVKLSCCWGWRWWWWVCCFPPLNI